MKSSILTTTLAVLLLSFTQAFAKTPAGWTDNYAKALEQARTEKKFVLLDFTGSDWCSWCIKLDKEVFDKAEFKTFAKDTLVLVKVDFPNAPLAKKTQAQNEKLKDQFKADGYPTTVIVNAEGKEVWRHEGYLSGGPSAFIKAISPAIKNP